MSFRSKTILIVGLSVSAFALLEFIMLRTVSWSTAAGDASDDAIRNGVFIATFAIGGAAMAFLAWAMWRSVFSSMAQLAHHMAALNRSDDLFVHLAAQRALTHRTASANDPAGAITTEFNALLTRLEHDLAERMRQQSALQDRETRLRAVVESAADGILTLTSDGTIDSFNPGAERIFDRASSETIGTNMAEMVADEDRDAWRAWLGETGHTANPARELRGVRLGGRSFPMLVTLSEMRLGGDLHFTVIVRDITELRRMHEEVLRSQHLAEIGEMGASIAHEIRNPIAAISGAVQVLEKNMPEDYEHKKVTNEILHEVKRVDDTVRYLLSFAKTWTPQIQTCDLPSLVLESIESVKQSEAFNAVTFVNESNGPVQSGLDPSLLQRILRNLFDNAREAMNGAGEIHWSAADTGDGVEIVVRNTGPAISREAAEKVFRPFFTTKTYGAGLGMAICLRIMEAHRGSIAIGPSSKGGTEVVLVFPKENTS